MKIQINTATLADTRQILFQALCPECGSDGCTEDPEFDTIKWCDWCKRRHELIRTIDTMGA